MSLSQKHSGKVLVPWFNISEWKSVHDLIYSNTAPDWPRALQILKIWKHRTPLLSAGVEGTLIILEALLINTNCLSTYETSHIFSTSLVRFLNLCAANSDRQGTFYKAAMKNELPRWLINVRHDIAHSHKIPSLSMLKLSLEFCLEWLKEKYWDVQFDNMADFIVGEIDSTIIKHGLFIYKYLDETDDKQKQRKVRQYVRKFIQNSMNPVSNEVIIQGVNDAISGVIKINKKESCDKICSILIDDLAILSIKCEEDESGNSRLPDHFLKKWNGLINIIYDAEIMPDFVSKLFEFTGNGKYEMRKVAALWIKEIYVGLMNEESGVEVDSGVKFYNRNDSLKNKNLVDQILETPGTFAADFLEEILRYNGAPRQFVEEAMSLVSAFSLQDGCTSDTIFTIDDLDIEDDPVEIDCPEKRTTSRWVLIEDTSSYVNLPLGILPHQDRNTNPLFVV